MRFLIQRVKSAQVTIEKTVHSEIGEGLLVFIGITQDDSEEDISYLIQKTVNLRIFNDSEGKMNLSILDTGGEMLLVSQFTLYASTSKGNRPSYMSAALPDIANPMYENVIRDFEIKLPLKIKKGVFGADMQVALINDGPVTISLDSKIRG